MASPGAFSDRLALPVPGDAQDEPSDDSTQARSITDADAENWGDIIQTLIMSDLDDRLVEAGSLSARAAAGTDAPVFYLVTDGGASGDQAYLTYNDDAAWHLVTPQAERVAITSAETPYSAEFGESIWVDASGGAVTVQLPAPDDRGRIRVVVTDSTNDVTLARAGTETIDGDAADIVLTTETVVEIETDGTNWRRTTVEGEQFVTKIEQVVDAPNGHIPTALLEDTESAEISVAVPDGETLTVHRWGGYKIADGTAPAGLRVELLDDADTAQAQANTANDEDTSSTGVAQFANSSGSLSIFKLRVVNATGGDLITDGVGAFFGYIVE